MIRIDEIIIVEGKHDKAKLKRFIDATIIETNGFRIFKDKAKQKMIRDLSKNHDILIMTDSDSAGFVIRNFLKSFIDTKKIKNVYMPEILGKEKRKDKASKEGLLGVEGISDDVILASIEKYINRNYDEKAIKITKANLFTDGLSGDGSVKKREMLLEKMKLPKYISVNAMLDIINTLLNFDEYKQIVSEIDDEIAKEN